VVGHGTRAGRAGTARRTCRRAAGAAVAALVGLALPAALRAPSSVALASTSATPPSSISLIGHGWGHGRGAGQWGALGYALMGEGYQQILAHYYGGTTPGTVPDETIRVVITENDGNDVIVTSDSPFTVAGIPFAAGQAARMHQTSSPGVWEIDKAAGCGGNPPGSPGGAWPVVGTATQPNAVAVPSTESPTATKNQVLELCMVGETEPLRGEIEAYEVDGVAHTVNVLPLEEYLQGVVPSESPAYWGTIGPSGAQGEPEGFQALEVQAVAARSYAVSGLGQYGYADICDSTACQVYRGMAAENPLTNLAIADTAGEVLLEPDGSVARTEYSASTGGYTAGGTFPPVPDLGDAVCVPDACNPNHDWSVTLSASSIEAAYPQIGTFLRLQVTARNGYGDLGGRVESLELVGTAATVTLTGNQFAWAMGLKSNWFALDAPAPPMTRLAGANRDATAIAVSQADFPTTGSAGAVVLASDASFPDALAGTPLAAAEHGPLLLTTPGVLDPSVLSEIERVLPRGGRVFVLGGPAAVAPAVDAALEQAGYAVTRLYGSTRAGTAVAVAEALGNPSTVLEATGTDFPDALAAGAAAVALHGAVLLTDGDVQAPETAAYLAAHPSDTRIAVGGPAAAADPGARAIVGQDRFATAVAVAEAFFPHPSVVGAASGLAFPDALAGGAAIGAQGGPMLLVPESGPLPQSVASYLGAVGSDVTRDVVFGGVAAVSDQVATEVGQALAGG
jgi:SpoIID/LytB domain protein